MKKYISIVIILLLVTFVFSLTKDELLVAKTCTSDGVTQIFDKYSDSEQTGYLINEKGEVFQFVCKEGKWIPTIEYAEMNKLDINKIELSNGLVASSNDEKGRDIIYSVASTIIVDKSKEVVINDKIYNIEYVPIINERIKCICDKKIGCTIKECLQ